MGLASDYFGGGASGYQDGLPRISGGGGYTNQGSSRVYQIPGSTDSLKVTVANHLAGDNTLGYERVSEDGKATASTWKIPRSSIAAFFGLLPDALNNIRYGRSHVHGNDFYITFADIDNALGSSAVPPLGSYLSWLLKANLTTGAIISCEPIRDTNITAFNYATWRNVGYQYYIEVNATGQVTVVNKADNPDVAYNEDGVGIVTLDTDLETLVSEEIRYENTLEYMNTIPDIAYVTEDRQIIITEGSTPGARFMIEGKGQFAFDSTVLGIFSLLDQIIFIQTGGTNDVSHHFVDDAVLLNRKMIPTTTFDTQTLIRHKILRADLDDYLKAIASELTGEVIV